MSRFCRIPVKEMKSGNWGDLGALGPRAFDIVGDRVDQKRDLSFAGNHRVRLYRFFDSVHFRIPEGIQLDIAGVAPGSAPRKR